MSKSFIIFLSALYILGVTIFICPQTSGALVQSSTTGAMNTPIFRIRAVLDGPKTRIKYYHFPLGFSPNGRTLAVGRHDGSIGLWDVATGQLKATLTSHNKWVSQLLFSQDGRMLVSASGDKTAKLWDAETGQLRATFDENKSRFMRVSLSPDGSLLAVGSDEDRSPKLWDTKPGSLTAILSDHDLLSWHYNDTITDVKFSPDGRTLATANFSRAYLWDVATRKLRMTLVDERYRRQEVEVVNHGGSKKKLIETYSHASTIYRLTFSPDGRMLATASRDGTAKLWDIETGQLTATLNHGYAKVRALAFSQDGRMLATGTEDGTARLWSVQTGKLLATLPHKGNVWSLSFSPDGKLLATASDHEEAVKVWDTAMGNLIAELVGAHYLAIFSSDGRTLATSGQGNTVILWDVTDHMGK